MKIDKSSIEWQNKVISQAIMEGWEPDAEDSGVNEYKTFAEISEKAIEYLEDECQDFAYDAEVDEFDSMHFSWCDINGYEISCFGNIYDEHMLEEARKNEDKRLYLSYDIDSDGCLVHLYGIVKD